MNDPVPPPGDRELLAAELALGVLEGDALAVAQRRLLADPAFAEEVEAWRERLAGIALEAADTEPPAALWARISAAIEAEDGDKGNVATLRQMRRWRAGAMGATALAAVLAGILAIPQTQVTSPPPITQTPGPAVVAQLRGEGEGPVIAARYDPQTAELRLLASDMGASELAPELWVIPADGVPRSLGLIQPAGGTRMVVAQGHRRMMADGATLAVTMEPRDGIPHSAPSSTPIASGIIFGI